MTGRPSRALEYAAFQHPPTALFRDYLAGEAKARAFYEGGRWDLEALLASADRALALARPRPRLTAALVGQQEERGAADAAGRARRLEDPRALAVVTGQQPVLFGGPLYVLYKALAAVRLAAALEERRGQPVVPVFWVASDDHDFAEVRSTAVLDEAGQIRTLRYTPHVEPVGRPIWQIRLDDTIDDLVKELGAALPPSPHREAALERVARCYQPGASFSEAFARLLSSILPGLVVMDPSDPRLKTLMLPVLSREIAERSPTSRLAEEIGRDLLRAGYHQQVPVRPGFLNLFVVMREQRRALALQDGLVEVRGLGVTMSLDDAARHLDAQPEDWSPGVLLRPLAQDHVLPTAAYVGGPAEIAYHAQIGPSYRHFGIPRPVLVPRPSLTVVEPAQARALEAEGLDLPDLQTDPEVLLAGWARDAYPQVESAFSRAREAVEREMKAVEETLAGLDPTLAGAADAAQGRAIHQIEVLHEKSVRALKKRDQSRADRLRRTRDALLPGGSFQERGLGLLALVARHGPGAVELVAERMDPWSRGHQVVYLP